MTYKKVSVVNFTRIPRKEPLFAHVKNTIIKSYRFNIITVQGSDCDNSK